MFESDVTSVSGSAFQTADSKTHSSVPTVEIMPTFPGLDVPDTVRNSVLLVLTLRNYWKNLPMGLFGLYPFSNGKPLKVVIADHVCTQGLLKSGFHK